MSRRDPLSVEAELHRQRMEYEADVKYRRYQRPLGDANIHIVKNRETGQEFAVAGPRETFREGEIVPTASNTGRQGEVILREPPPGRKGSSPPRPAIVFLLPAVPAITGDYNTTGYASSGDPWDETYTITGSGFAATNVVEFYDLFNVNGDPIDHDFYSMVVTGVTFVSSTELTVRIQAPFNASSSWRFRVFPSAGSSTFADTPIDPDEDPLDATWGHSGF